MKSLCCNLIPKPRQALVSAKQRKNIKDRWGRCAPGEGGSEGLCHGTKLEPSALGIGAHNGFGRGRVPILNRLQFRQQGGNQCFSFIGEQSLGLIVNVKWPACPQEARS